MGEGVGRGEVVSVDSGRERVFCMEHADCAAGCPGERAHRIVKVLSEWNAERREYGTVFVHADACPVCSWLSGAPHEIRPPARDSS